MQVEQNQEIDNDSLGGENAGDWTGSEDGEGVWSRRTDALQQLLDWLHARSCSLIITPLMQGACPVSVVSDVVFMPGMQRAKGDQQGRLKEGGP